jgi:peptide-methionine (S)-S-oxide reductase
MNSKNNVLETAVFGGGCFWCTEAVFATLKGVVSVLPGYAGGKKSKPSYEEVSGGGTGHAEVIQIQYDPSVISFGDLLAVFFHVHDPTQMNRQGNDVGTQYRSVIFYTTDVQKQEAEMLITELTASKAYDKPIVTEVKSLEHFYPAEEYHRDYYKRNSDAPYCELVIVPKLEKLQKRFAGLMKA